MSKCYVISVILYKSIYNRSQYIYYDKIHKGNSYITNSRGLREKKRNSDHLDLEHLERGRSTVL